MSGEAEAGLRAALAEAGPDLRLWWRDDDAGRPHPRLERLLALAARHEAPLALAVVPAWLEPEVAASIARCPQASVLQHGIAHRNWARAGERKIELGGGAERGQLHADLRAGRELLARAFGDAFLPMLVPPWNRIAPDLLAELPGLGYSACSTFASRRPPPMVAGLAQRDTHLDLIAWREGSRPLSFAETAAGLAALVRQRPAGPIGILTHHLVMDDGAFLTLDRLLALLHDRAAPGLVAIGSLLRPGPC